MADALPKRPLINPLEIGVLDGRFRLPRFLVRVVFYVEVMAWRSTATVWTRLRLCVGIHNQLVLLSAVG